MPLNSVGNGTSWECLRIATPEEVAHAICFLLHPNTTLTTGHALPVDGGLTELQAHGLVHHKAAA
ncbi:hypothetical protein MNEG_15471 [Monoraphidium neglectum]|uniref:Uncharacterized protein n=1 Tax=Monoraphidium neglectum TaxID=145388 RepID=A0A0D2LRE5_9CHLO|nr:hypothetical protein MNEG_15471 [Monoraphidium neglectum]KIY92491.1 hypothetical protein MNEG_15471 [Monoraphidium neglectum]|eukprot:XP_013891511.1 hypothetical protein MNEG_15471 [Monoraphidium neglectum]